MAPRDYGDAPVLPLLEAVARQRTVRIDYDSRSSGRAWRSVDPYAVAPRDGVYWELHGWCHRNQEMRTFAVDRIHGVDASDGIAPFDVRAAEWAAFQQKTGIGGIRGGERIEVAVRFTPDVAPWALDRRWPEGLTVALEPDGVALLRGRIHGSTDALLSEILRWRRHATVIGGPALRARMAEELQAMAGLYVE